jgi:D-sedoheptulose 7-phosphate isomerase
LARPGDVFLGISTSGNAKNLIYASYVAKLVGLPIIILTGMNKGFLSNFADVSLIAPAYETTLVQEWHVKIYHILCEMLEIWLLEG